MLLDQLTDEPLVALFLGTSEWSPVLVFPAGRVPVLVRAVVVEDPYDYVDPDGSDGFDDCDGFDDYDGLDDWENLDDPEK
jgi:hypothetical protein